MHRKHCHKQRQQQQHHPHHHNRLQNCAPPLSFHYLPPSNFYTSAVLIRHSHSRRRRRQRLRQNTKCKKSQNHKYNFKSKPAHHQQQHQLSLIYCNNFEYRRGFCYWRHKFKNYDCYNCERAFSVKFLHRKCKNYAPKINLIQTEVSATALITEQPPLLLAAEVKEIEDDDVVVVAVVDDDNDDDDDFNRNEVENVIAESTIESCNTENCIGACLTTKDIGEQPLKETTVQQHIEDELIKPAVVATDLCTAYHNNNNYNDKIVKKHCNIVETPKEIIKYNSESFCNCTSSELTSQKSSSSENFCSNKSQNQQQNDNCSFTSTKENTPKTTLPSCPILSADKSINLEKLLQVTRFVDGGNLNLQKLENYLQTMDKMHMEFGKRMASMGCVVKYMVEELDAFSCPTAKQDCARSQDTLNRTLQLLEEAKETCQQLQNQLSYKEAQFAQKEEDQSALHRTEMEQAKENLHEMQMLAKQRIREVEAELERKDIEHRRTMDAYHKEMTHKLTQKTDKLFTAEEHIRHLQQRVQTLEANELALRETLTRTENQCAGRLSAAAEREQDFQDHIKSLTRELNTLQSEKEKREQQLRAQLSQSQDELLVARTSMRSRESSWDEESRDTRESSSMSGSSETTVQMRNSMNNSCPEWCDRSLPTTQRDTPRKSSGQDMAHFKDEVRRLESETDSLRTVLELKQHDISKLTKINEEQQRRIDEYANTNGKASKLEAEMEMLKMEKEKQNEREKDLLRQIETYQQTIRHNDTKSQRLSMDKEALQWQLKQRSEQIQRMKHDQSVNISNNSCPNCSRHSLGINSTMNGSNASTDTGHHASPPASPIVKGVIEKKEAVSYVLEIEDGANAADVVVPTRMVKRANSLRSSLERSPTQRRLHSVSACAGSSSSNDSITGPNPLSQSMSASVIRQHSHEALHVQSSQSLARTRSQSMVNKCKTRGVVSNVVSCQQETAQWNNSFGNSSAPVNGGCNNESSSNFVMRPRTSTMKQSSAAAAASSISLTSTPIPKTAASSELFCRNSAPHLITCDTSALNSGERLDLHTAYPHKSAVEKFQEIQESAGEAMVSGTNSEDESCSASSEDIASSASSAGSLAAKHSATLIKQQQQQQLQQHQHSTQSQQQQDNMSIEEVLLIERGNSLSGTPMEVSWSEDMDAYSNESTA